MIRPTVGRVVWYRPGKYDDIARIDGAPLAAIVASVFGDDCVNLTVFDAMGVAHPRTSVTLVQDGGPPVEALGDGASYCEWMPYQKGQAAKTEALEARLAAAEGRAGKTVHGT